MKKRWAAWRVGDIWTLDADVNEIAKARFVDTSAHYVTEDETDELLNGDSHIAEERARKALTVDPSDSQAQLLLGASLRKQKRFEEAKSILEPLAKSMPHVSMAWQELGLSLAPLGERGKAIKAFMRAIDLHYMDRTSWFWLGDLLDFGMPGHQPDPRLTEARAAYREIRYQDAEAISREVLKDTPDNTDAMGMLADALIRLGNWPEAKRLYERRVELEPDSHFARFRCATMLFLNGQLPSALPHIDALLKHDPESKLYHGLQAVCLLRNQQYAVALAAFESFIEDCDDQPGLWVEYARVLKIERP
ncbi:MAG TPA: tetratricopeptide repeat protein, partial [Rhizomicrobium sp.]